MDGTSIKIALVIVAALYLIIEASFQIWSKRSKLPPKIAEDAAVKGADLLESKIRKTILMRNADGIEDIQKLESLRSLYYHPEQYPVIAKMIREAKDADTIRNFSIHNPTREEDIDIMTFVDQLDRRWVVVIYDSWELSQDPEAIDIFPAAF